MLYCHKGRGTEGMKDKGSREAPFFLLKISHRNAYRQANIFKVFGFSEGGESKKANCTTFLRIASVLYTGRHALRPVMCMERFYPKEWHESQQQQICCQNSVLLYMFYPFHLSGKYRFLCRYIPFRYCPEDKNLVGYSMPYIQVTGNRVSALIPTMGDEVGSLCHD